MSDHQNEPKTSVRRILGPKLDAAAQCDAVLRSLPAWFGIEDALLMYAERWLIAQGTGHDATLGCR